MKPGDLVMARVWDSEGESGFESWLPPGQRTVGIVIAVDARQQFGRQLSTVSVMWSRPDPISGESVTDHLERWLRVVQEGA